MWEREAVRKRQVETEGAGSALNMSVRTVKGEVSVEQAECLIRVASRLNISSMC